MRRSDRLKIAGAGLSVILAAMAPGISLAKTSPASGQTAASPQVSLVAIHAQFKAKDQQITDLKQQLSDANAEIGELKDEIIRLKTVSAPVSANPASPQVTAAADTTKPMSDVEKVKYLTMQYILKRPMHCVASLSNNPGHIMSIKITDVKNSGSADYPYDVYAAVKCHYDKPLSDSDTTQTSIEHTVCAANPTTGKVILKPSE